MSKFGQALKICKSDPVACEYLRAHYWARHSKTRNARYGFFQKAEEMRPKLSDETRKLVSSVSHIWRPGQ